MINGYRGVLTLSPSNVTSISFYVFVVHSSHDRSTVSHFAVASCILLIVNKTTNMNWMNRSGFICIGI